MGLMTLPVVMAKARQSKRKLCRYVVFSCQKNHDRRSDDGHRIIHQDGGADAHDKKNRENQLIDGLHLAKELAADMG